MAARPGEDTVEVREAPGNGRPRVVVAGAGFGGLWAARALEGRDVDVFLLDRNNYHTFFPLLYQVAAAELGPTEIAYPVRSILRGASNVSFRMATVRGLDLGARELLTDLGPVAYDRLILALGSEPAFFGVEGAERHAFPLRWMDQAMPLRHHILSRFESAAHEADPERRRALLTFAIVGGGPTGVEFAGALAELVYGPLRTDYPMLRQGDIRVVLVEMMDRLLGGMPEKLGAYALERLEHQGVEVLLESTVERVTAATLELEEQAAVATETVVWTAGVQGDPRVAEWGLPVGRGGRVPVTPALHLEDHPEVYVVGDLAYLEEEGEPLPQVAPVALQQGEHAAANALRSLRGEDLLPFDFDDPGMLAVIGRSSGVAHVWGRAFTGFTAWVLWLAVHIVKLIGFRNRLLVLVNWAWNYISYERAVRLILPYDDEEDAFENEVDDVREVEERLGPGEQVPTNEGLRSRQK